jgi:hypothetical protein
MNFYSRPKDKYLHQADWQELYVLTEHWQSELAYYQDELRFLRMLIDNNLKLLIEDEGIKKVQEVALKLSEIETQKLNLEQNTNKHLNHLQDFIKNSSSKDSREFRDEHEYLEIELTGFVKNFRSLKKNIFKLSEQVMQTEKAKHLLKP